MLADAPEKRLRGCMGKREGCDGGFGGRVDVMFVNGGEAMVLVSSSFRLFLGGDGSTGSLSACGEREGFMSACEGAMVLKAVMCLEARFGISNRCYGSSSLRASNAGLLARFRAVAGSHNLVVADYGER